MLFPGKRGNVRELFDQRRRRLNRPHERMLGSLHGHNSCPTRTKTRAGRICASCDRLRDLAPTRPPSPASGCRVAPDTSSRRLPGRLGSGVSPPSERRCGKSIR